MHSRCDKEGGTFREITNQLVSGGGLVGQADQYPSIAIIGLQAITLVVEYSTLDAVGGEDP